MTKRQWIIVQQAMSQYRNSEIPDAVGQLHRPYWDDTDGDPPTDGEIDETVTALDFALKGEIEGDEDREYRLLSEES